MKIFLYTIPVAFLVAYSQLIVKWRIISGVQHVYINSTYDKYLSYFLDPYILSAYFIALLASFIWFIVIQRIPLSIGFPIYIGSVFLMVMLGSWILLGEEITLMKIFALILILGGIILGSLN
jgi:multidrug transporter EmrE-like cation transporter